MGDRYEFSEICPNCLVRIQCHYAESCEQTTVVCPNCKKEFKIIMEFKLVEKKK